MSYTVKLTFRNGRDISYKGVEDRAAENLHDHMGEEGAGCETISFRRPNALKLSFVGIDMTEVIVIEIHPEGEDA
jgi:hypothetical protein